MTVTLVAAIASNGVIGRDGGLPWHLPEDLARFKRLTLGHPMVMGRRTYESIGRPLPGRRTVVVTRQPDWRAPGVSVRASVADALDDARGDGVEVFVVGGSEVYAAAMSYADRMVLTHVHRHADGDRRFPEVDWDAWRAVDRDEGPEFTVVTYARHATD